MRFELCLIPWLTMTTTDLSTCLCFIKIAHARLMFRGEVIRVDAVAAVVCMESSMTTSAILDGMGNALHSSFADNPDEECILSLKFFTFFFRTIPQLTDSIFFFWALHAINYINCIFYTIRQIQSRRRKFCQSSTCFQVLQPIGLLKTTWQTRLVGTLSKHPKIRGKGAGRLDLGLYYIFEE